MSQHDGQEELASALKAVLDDRAQDDAARRRERAEAKTPRARPQGPLLVVMLAALAATAWIWTVRPEAIFGPGTLPPRTAEAREAKARFALYLQHARVHSYVAAHGRPPASLAEAGPVEDGVTLATSPGGWSVQGEANGTTLVLTDRMAADSFLGNALEVLRQDQ